MKSLRFLVCLLLLAASGITAQSKLVEASIGIIVESSDKSRMLKKYDVLSSDESFRVAVEAFSELYTYIVYSDVKEVTLLNGEGSYKLTKKDVMMLPSKDEAYALEDVKKANITVLCSKEKLTQIEKFFADEKPSAKEWKKLEKQIYISAKADLNKTSDKPVSLAGTVRGKEELKVRKYKSNNLIFRKYEMKFKK